MTTRDREDSDVESTDGSSPPLEEQPESIDSSVDTEATSQEDVSSSLASEQASEPSELSDSGRAGSGAQRSEPADESEQVRAPEKEADSPRTAPPKPHGKSSKKKKRSKEKRGPGGGGAGLTPLGFVLRFFAAIALVFGTFNPSENSYYHWVSTLEGADLPAKILLGLLILAGWVVFFRATSRSLGPVGAILAASVCGVTLWWLIDLQIVSQESDAITYAVLFIISIILTLGLTGSFVWRRLTGQYQVDADDGGMDD